VKSDWSS